MQIIVEGHLIETRDIWDITEAPRGYHGFHIKLIGGQVVFIGEKQPVDRLIERCREINDQYKALREKIKAKWQEDKTDLPIYKLNP